VVRFPELLVVGVQNTVCLPVTIYQTVVKKSEYRDGEICLKSIHRLLNSVGVAEILPKQEPEPFQALKDAMNLVSGFDRVR